jgi:hypothetical protein
MPQWREPFVLRGSKPDAQALMLLRERFGHLPDTYLQVFEQLGMVAFRSGYYGMLRVLSPNEVIELFDHVQSEMDFASGLREMLLSEDGIDFSQLIPVMSGHGIDGKWALLDISSSEGRVFLWDTDQAGYFEDIFDNLPTLIVYLLEKAQTEDPPRLTSPWPY